MSKNSFDFDQNPKLPTADYDIAVRQSIPGIAARLRAGSPFVLVDSHGDKQSEVFKRLVDGWQR